VQNIGRLRKLPNRFPWFASSTLEAALFCAVSGERELSKPLVQRLAQIQVWQLVLITAVVSEISTAALSSGLTLLVWGRISFDILAVGSVDAFAVSAFLSSVLIYFTRHSVALEASDQDLKSRLAERERVERDLRESEQRFRSVIEQASDGLVLVDEHARIIEWNRAMERIWGVEKVQVIGKPFWDVQFNLSLPENRSPEQFERLKDMALEALRTGESSIFDKPIKTLARRADGEQRFIEQKIFPIKSAGGFRLGSITRDITDQNQAEQGLRESEDRFRSFVENTSEWIFMTDEVGTIVEWNRGAEQITGIQRQATLGKPAWDVQYQLVSNGHKNTNTYERLQSTFCEALQTGTSPVMNRSVEAQFRRADGTVRMAEQRLFPIKTARGFRLSGISRDITERKHAEHQIQQQLQRLTALHTMDTAITASFDLALILDLFLEQVMAQGGVDAAAVLLFTESTQTLDFAAGRGFRTEVLRHTRLRLGEGLAGRVALERCRLTLSNLGAAEGDFKRAPLLVEEGFTGYSGFPIISKGNVNGVLEIFNRSPFDPDQEWLAFLETLATQAAIAIDNMRLFGDLQKSNAELSLAYDTTLEGWSRALDLRDKETEGHTQRVTELAVRLSRAMGINEAELVHVRRGALLHDIGKMGIPDSILLKPGPLTDEEWLVMKSHPGMAYEMLLPIHYLKPALSIPFCHHEKWDGSGYPRGLRAEEIPLTARIFALADVWDALCSDRPYRAAWPEGRVREYIRSQAGTHFDPTVAEIFLKMVGERDTQKVGVAGNSEANSLRYI
jgi:PAS domain S-box-containing protein